MTDLTTLARSGLSLRQISAQTGDSYTTTVKRLGSIRAARRHYVYTQEEVAVLFGVSTFVPRRWFRLGLIKGQRTSTGTSMAGRQWRVTRSSVRRFLSVREAWPSYEPERITDPSLRAIAQQARAGGDYVLLASLTGVLFLAEETLRRRVRVRNVPVLRYGRRLYVWSGDVEKLK